MNRKTRKLLMVTWPIKPGRGGSVQIVEKLLRNFTADEVSVIGELPFLGRAPRRDADRPQVHYFRSGFSVFGRGARFFAAFRWMMFKLLVRKICRVARREECNYILAIFPDEFYCYAACLASKKLGLPFSTYFHNTYIDNVAVDQRRGAVIQPELFGRSEFIFVMSEGMKRFYEQKYQLTNVVALVHTFEKFPACLAQSTEPLAAKQSIKLVLFGNFNHSNIEATRRFLNAVARDSRYRVSIYTHVPAALLRLRGIETDGIVLKGYIDDAVLIQELQQYDITVLTHGFTGAYGPVEYRTIFPTRTIPMLLSGKPIFVHSPPEAFLTEFAKEHQIGCVIDEANEEKILAGLNRIVSDTKYCEEIVHNAGETAKTFYGPNVVSLLRSKLGM